jgi:aspartate aminotransferase
VITDNKEFHEKCIAEQTANLCANAIGQYIFGAIAHETSEALVGRYEKQRTYYGSIIKVIVDGFKKYLPGVIIANPEVAIYLVIDVRTIVKAGFDGRDFALFCAKDGAVTGDPLSDDRQRETILISPLSGFYQVNDQTSNP